MQFLPLFIVVLVAVSIVRNVLRLMRKIGEAETAAPRQRDGYDPALAERTRRIQDEIRRKIAERRGTTVVPEAMPVGPRMEPPVIMPEPPAARAYATTAAILERQQQLADQMRALELARATEVRRALEVNAAVKTAAESQGGMLVGAREDLLADLKNPLSLRRAFVLREILGAPVGLR